MSGRGSLPRGAADPVFVGGTGRSGTHVMSHVIGEHPAYFYFRREMRFHTDPGGFPDLLAGRTTPDRFVEAMKGHFWRRVGRDGRERGLYMRFPRDRYDAAVDRFRSGYDADPRAACRTLMNELLDPLAEEAGKATWLEQTPPTAAAADTLHQVFPGMKLIHMVRDGRDVACSVVGRGTGPDSLGAGIEQWERRLRAGHAATGRIPPDRHLVVHLEDLVLGDRDRAYETLMSFLGVEPEPRSRRWLDRHVTADAANLGRWRRDLSESDQLRVSRLYRRSLERLRRDGVTSAPSLSDANLPEEARKESWLGRARSSLTRVPTTRR